MTVMEASAATGINPKVIYAHIHKGTLDATCGLNGRYDISTKELYRWHVWMWRTSRATMFPRHGVVKSLYGILDCVSGRNQRKTSMCKNSGDISV